MINSAATKIAEDLHWQKRREALTAIEEIPEQVEDALQRSASILVDEVQDKVADMREKIRDLEPCDGQTRIERAVESLEVIPEIIQDSFEASSAKVKSTVQHQVDSMIHGIEVNDLACEQIVTKMWMIPAQVQQIAGELMEQAVQESRDQAKRQFDFALASLPEVSETIRKAKSQIVARVPSVYPATLRAARAVAAGNVEQAVAAVPDRQEVEQAVANQVVADTLLRAKARNSLTPGPRLNPGSTGHPELCPRPCLFFAAGTCANGLDCNFCHLPHPKRPAHLDKRHREMLKDLPLAESVALVVPILKEKTQALGFGPDVMRMVERLEQASEGPGAEERLSGPDTGVEADEHGVGVEPGQPPKMSRGSRMLLVALRAMSVRSLLTALHRTVAPRAPQTCHLIDGLLQQLRYQSHLQALGIPGTTPALAMPSCLPPGLSPTFHAHINVDVTEELSDVVPM